MHGPDPRPWSGVRSLCLNSTNPHLSPGWSRGPLPGLGQIEVMVKVQVSWLDWNLYLIGAMIPCTERGALNSFLVKLSSCSAWACISWLYLWSWGVINNADLYDWMPLLTWTCVVTDLLNPDGRDSLHVGCQMLVCIVSRGLIVIEVLILSRAY